MPADTSQPSLKNLVPTIPKDVVAMRLTRELFAEFPDRTINVDVSTSYGNAAYDIKTSVGDPPRANNSPSNVLANIMMGSIAAAVLVFAGVYAKKQFSKG